MPITDEVLLEATETMAPVLARFAPFQVIPQHVDVPERLSPAAPQISMDRMEVVFHRNRWCVWLVARPNDVLVDLQARCPIQWTGTAMPWLRNVSAAAAYWLAAR